jgi:hypothetical protein
VVERDGRRIYRVHACIDDTVMSILELFRVWNEALVLKLLIIRLGQVRLRDGAYLPRAGDSVPWKGKEMVEMRVLLYYDDAVAVGK